MCDKHTSICMTNTCNGQSLSDIRSLIVQIRKTIAIERVWKLIVSDTADLTAATTSQTHWPSLRVVVIGLLKATAAHIIGHAAQLARLQYCWYCTSCGAGVLPIALFAMASDCWSHSGAFSVALHRLCCRGHAVKYCWCCKNIIFSRLCM